MNLLAELVERYKEQMEEIKAQGNMFKALKKACCAANIEYMSVLCTDVLNALHSPRMSSCAIGASAALQIQLEEIIESCVDERDIHSKLLLLNVALREITKELPNLDVPIGLDEDIS